MEHWTQTLAQLKSFLWNLVYDLPLLGGAALPFLKKLLLVMLGGGLGAVSRFGIASWTAKALGGNFPWGTLIVNLAGCFLIGLLFGLADRHRMLTPDVRLLLITGYLGAMTTFSTFAMESMSAGRAGLVLLSLVNILANNLGGLALAFFGFWLTGSPAAVTKPF